jgi:hypothetical protein
MTGPTHLGTRSSFSLLLVYFSPFFSVRFFLKLSRDVSFPGVRRWGRGWVCLLEVDVDLVLDSAGFDGEDLAFARLRAEEVVSVRSK